MNGKTQFGFSKNTDAQIRKGGKCIQLFHPIGNLTNPLWIICSPVLVTAYKFTSEYTNIKANLDTEAKRFGKTRGALVRDMAYSLFAFGASSTDYFDLDFPIRNNLGRSEFVTEISSMSIYPHFNDLSKRAFFDDKVKIAETLKKWYHREYVPLEKKDDVPLCAEFLQKHGDGILKPLCGSMGQGVQLVTSDLPEPETFFQKRLTEGKWIFEERIIQGGFLADIHPASVNTVRIHTFVSKKGEVRLFYPYLRMGRGGSVMDNYSAGGLTALVDPDTGYLFGTVFPLDKDNVLCHPDTGCRVIGQQLPQWEEAKAMAFELARVFKDFRFIGWDFAYSKEHGWVVIEANCRPGTTSWQEILGKGLKKDYEEMIRWADEN